MLAAPSFLQAALEAEDDDLLEAAIMEAKQLDYKDDSVAKAAARPAYPSPSLPTSRTRTTT